MNLKVNKGAIKASVGGFVIASLFPITFCLGVRDGDNALKDVNDSYEIVKEYDENANMDNYYVVSKTNLKNEYHSIEDAKKAYEERIAYDLSFGDRLYSTLPQSITLFGGVGALVGFALNRCIPEKKEKTK